MAKQEFTPSTPLSSNERDWQAEIGMLPWNTSIVFSKESLVRFLKQLEVEVDTNMSQLKKLPKYATFGTLSGDNAASAPPTTTNITAPAPIAKGPFEQSEVPAFIPTRKVREQPGGGSSQIASLLAGSAENDHENWKPTPLPSTSYTAAPLTSEPPPNQAEIVDNAQTQQPRVLMPDGSAFIPTRKVREPTGGFSSMASILSGN